MHVSNRITGTAELWAIEPRVISQDLMLWAAAAAARDHSKAQEDIMRTSYVMCRAQAPCKASHILLTILLLISIVTAQYFAQAPRPNPFLIVVTLEHENHRDFGKRLQTLFYFCIPVSFCKERRRLHAVREPLS